MTEKNIILIRHGRTQGNEEHRYVGTTDEPLLPESIKVLQTMRKFWESHLVKQIEPALYVSPYIRARQTAEILFPGVKQTVIEDYAEMCFGEFEYKNYEQLNGNPAYQMYIDSGGTTAFPGGESMDVFKKRIFGGFLKMMDDVTNRDAADIVIVAHGGTIMALLDLLSKPHQDYFSWQVKPGEGVMGLLKQSKERMDSETENNVCRTNIYNWSGVPARYVIGRPTLVMASCPGNRMDD